MYYYFKKPPLSITIVIIYSLLNLIQIFGHTSVTKTERQNADNLNVYYVMYVVSTRWYITLHAVIHQYTNCVWSPTCVIDWILSLLFKWNVIFTHFIRSAFSVVIALSAVDSFFLNYLLDNSVILTEGTLYRRTLSTTEQQLIQSIFAKIF